MGESRAELILENILGASHELGEPQSRIEVLLMELLEELSGGSVVNKKLYQHLVNFSVHQEHVDEDATSLYAIIINDSYTPFTNSSLYSYFDSIRPSQSYMHRYINGELKLSGSTGKHSIVCIVLRADDLAPNLIGIGWSTTGGIVFTPIANDSESYFSVIYDSVTEL